MIALDAMGGDDAPAVPIAAARRAVAEYGLEVTLVGDARLLAELGVDGSQPGLRVVTASQVVSMDEDPALGVRGKPDASIRVALRLSLAEGGAAVVSAGSTGATLTAALLDCGRVAGVRRPAVAAALPTPGSTTVLVDAGASADARPEALVAYARMGRAYARVRGVQTPTVGLLNVGHERGKGSELARAAHNLMVGESWFAGNVEPGRVLAGDIDVVVTDGFTGNVFLKTVEAMVSRDPRRGHGGRDRPGAAVLLGVAATVLVAHGAATVGDLVAALRSASEIGGADLPDRLAAALVEH